MPMNHLNALQIAENKNSIIRDDDQHWLLDIQNTLPNNPEKLFNLIVNARTQTEALKTYLSQVEKTTYIYLRSRDFGGSKIG